LFAKHQPTTPAQTKSPIEHAPGHGELARADGQTTCESSERIYRTAGSYDTLLQLLAFEYVEACEFVNRKSPGACAETAGHRESMANP
jgi:hypothetical protein